MTRLSTHQWPAISVVIPTRDRPVLLRRAVAGVMAQTYPGPIECIVVFDGTEPDHDLERSSPQRDVRVMGNVRRSGLPGARNSGFLASRGEFLASCDDDDFWLPDKLSRQIAALEADPDALAAVCGIRVETNSRVIDRPLLRTRIRYVDLLRSRIMEAHSSTIVVRRQQVLEIVGLIDENMPHGSVEDYDWLLRLTLRSEIAVVPEVLVLVRFHGGSWFTGKWEKVAADLEYLLRKHSDLHLDPAGAARLYAQLAFAYAGHSRRALSLSWAKRAFRRNWRERRTYLALAVLLGAGEATTFERLARTRGRGI